MSLLEMNMRSDLLKVYDRITPPKLLFRFVFRCLFLFLFLFRFCWIKALPAHSCHHRAMGCGIGGGDSGSGRNRRCKVKPKPIMTERPRPLSEHEAWFRTPPASGDHQLPGANSMSTSYPVDDVHQVRITECVGG